MELGFTVDFGRVGARQMEWHPGPPEAQVDKFLGFNLSPEGVVEVDLSKLRPVATYRCPECGLLSSYA